jgi:hypothetical protein
MEESIMIKERLIEACKVSDHMPGAALEVVQSGIICKWVYQNANGTFMKVENFTPWQAVERAPRNPLIAALGDLTKQKEAVSL